MTKYYATDFTLDELLHFLEVCAQEFAIDMSTELGIAVMDSKIIAGCNNDSANDCIIQKSNNRIKEIDRSGNVLIQPKTQFLFNYQFFV